LELNRFHYVLPEVLKIDLSKEEQKKRGQPLPLIGPGLEVVVSFGDGRGE